MSATSNPFSTGRLERLLAFDPGLVGESWEALQGRWEGLGRRACVTGPHGAGKTTFLDAFAARQPQSVLRLFFNDGHRRLDGRQLDQLEQVADAVVVLDGDAHLRWTERRLLWRRLRGAHGVLSARHRARDLPELLKLAVTPELARCLLGRLGEEVADRIAPELPRLFQKHHGNLRELWLECYDLWRSAETSERKVF